jgi:CheY-like chemotaxis protein
MKEGTEMAKKRILVIDDEKSFTRLVRLTLEETGRYKVIEENKGSQGLSITRKIHPDLILLDIVMPDVDGGEVAAQIKNAPDLKDIPIVFLTAVIKKSEETVIGGIPYIAKPVTLNKLIMCIEDNLSR